MKRTLLYSLLYFILVQPAIGQDSISLDYYLPGNIRYDERIPKPEEIIGHEVGAWHVTHDKLVMYMEAIAKASDRISIRERGKTFEGRPLLLLTVTSPENHGRLEEIRKEHIALTEEAGANVSVDDMPIVVYQGFSIHGNEPSGANAALAYAYYLAAATGPEVDAMLDNTIILLDPSFNPDGLQRFAYWANTNKSVELNPDGNEREYHEVWPGGRTNHYWFDLNRDWLPAQLPESRARIVTFHEWLPNIVTDHHEMGTNATFFFQPGEPTRVHPLTPKRNQELTSEIGNYHARALDKIGSLYFTEENYDDYYYGKGSTFPDVNGGIGILFEQASSRGHVQETDNGLLTFAFTIRNQFTTALSTIEAAGEMRRKLLSYQQGFFADLRNEAGSSKTKAFVFGDSKDAAKTWHLAEILHRQHIRFNVLDKDLDLEGKSYKKGYSYVVPANQKNYRLIQAMFEKRTSFQDSLFYDISGWTFPLAFNVDYSELSSLANAGTEVSELTPLTGSIDDQSSYAYLFEWNEYYTPKALNKILNRGIRAKVAKSPFALEGTSYDYGTIMIPVNNQKLNPTELYQFLKEVAREDFVRIHSVSTGLTQGIDLGSGDLETLHPQKVAILVGKGIRSSDAGEIWHLFDTRYAMKITKIDTDYFKSANLSTYTDIIIPDSYGAVTLDKMAAEKLKEWVKAGGTLIGYTSVAKWMDKNEIADLKFKTDTLVAKNITYEQREDYLGAQETSGAIFQAKLDRSHPINYGYKGAMLPVFRNSNIYLEPDKESYNNPIQYTESPLMSGYISKENQDLIKNSVPFSVRHLGNGRVIVFTDNTNFRAFWYGTNKLLMNAVFFGPMM